MGYVVIDVTVSGGSAAITITTAEGASTITGIDWSGSNGEIFVRAQNASLENLAFGW
jgi:hypothetical protein